MLFVSSKGEFALEARAGCSDVVGEFLLLVSETLLAIPLSKLGEVHFRSPPRPKEDLLIKDAGEFAGTVLMKDRGELVGTSLTEVGGGFVGTGILDLEQEHLAEHTT